MRMNQVLIHRILSDVSLNVYKDSSSHFHFFDISIDYVLTVLVKIINSVLLVFEILLTWFRYSFTKCYMLAIISRA